MAAAKKTVPTAEQVADAFQTIADFFRAGGSLPGGDSTPAGDVEKLDEDEVRGLTLLELRKLAKELGLDEQKVKNGILDEMAEKGMFEDSEEEEEEDEDDTSEEDEDEEGEEEEVDLESMSLKELRELAKEEGHPRASWIKADKDALIELLSEEEEGEEDDEEEEDEEEETEELDEDTIRAMSLAEVKKLAAELKVKISPTIAKNRKKIADKILDEMAEEE